MGIRTAVLMLTLVAAAPAQVVVTHGDLGVATSDGFWRVLAWPAQALPTHHLGPAAFGMTALVQPRIAWEPGTDSFLLSTGPSLFRVTLNIEGATVDDISPALGPGVQFSDMDLHPGNGRLLLLDRVADEALFFDPPFAAGMTPVMVLPVDTSAQAVCVDSRQYPESIIYSTTDSVDRRTLSGATSLVAFLARADALDDDPQFMHRTFIVHAQDNRVVVSQSTPNFVQDLNVVGFCSPVAISPNSVAYDPNNNRTYVLALDGVNSTCVPGGAAGVNHIVALPPAIGPVLPKVITHPMGSGITGTDGSLALVTKDFSFGYPYGLACDGPGNTAPRLLPDGPATPFPGQDQLKLKVTQAAALRPILLMAGSAPQTAPFGSGCTLLVVPGAIFPVGTTNNKGKLLFEGRIPENVPLGTDIYLQAVVRDPAGSTLSEGLQLHIAVP